MSQRRRGGEYTRPGSSWGPDLVDSRTEPETGRVLPHLDARPFCYR